MVGETSWEGRWEGRCAVGLRLRLRLDLDLDLGLWLMWLVDDPGSIQGVQILGAGQT